MPENRKQNEGIESRCNVEEPKMRGRDRIWARCQRTRIKRTGSNLGSMPENSKKTEGSNLYAIPENLKQREGMEFGHVVGESEIKERDQI